MILKKLLLISTMVYISSILMQVFFGLNASLSLRVYQKIILIGIEFGSLFIGYFLYKKVKRKNIMPSQRFYAFVLVTYVLHLMYFLFFDQDFGRSITVINNNINANIINGVNFIPFKMISDYLIAYENGNIYLVNVLLNIIGNIAIFIPIGLLLPIVFDKLKKPIIFIIIISIMIITIEVSQLVLGVGVFDVDDFILNFIGAFCAYIFYQLFMSIKMWRDNNGR